MTKPQKPARRGVSIQTQLILGTGAILILALIIALAGYISLRVLQGRIETVLQQANQVRESSLQFENQFLLAREAEAAYIDAWQSVLTGGQALPAEYVDRNEEYVAAAQSELQRMRGLVQAARDPRLSALGSDVDALDPLLGAYQDAFQVVVDRINARSARGGLDTTLKAELSSLESLLANATNPRFRELVLRIRANEQAYFNTGRQEYVDNVHLRLDDMLALIEATDYAELGVSDPTVSKVVIGSHATMYGTTFDQVIKIDQEININTTVFREVTGDIESITGRVAAQSAEGLTRAQAALATTVRRTLTAVGATGFLALALSVAVAAVVGRGIIRPLGQLTRAAERLGSGELEQRVAVRGGSELVTLADAFNSMAGRMRGMIGSLEQQVADRTRSLRAAAEVSQATTSLLDPDELMRRVVELVRDRFQLYYAGLFLLGEAEEGQYAVLRAAAGQAAEEMLARHHRLRVGSESMIGWCVAHNQARIAQDVDLDATRFANPLLPDTRSELALPLRSRGRVIGAMTAQSTRPGAFDEADVAAMQTMADQVAGAIDNARLFAATQAALEDISTTQRHYLEQAWRSYTTQAEAGLIRYEAGRAGAAQDAATKDEIRQAVARRQPVTVAAADYTALVIPVVVRDQVIGVLRIHDDRPDRQWTTEETELAAAVGERLGLAADNLRLLDESQRRAARERLTREITAHLRETLDVDVVLDTGVGDIVQALQLTALDVRLGTALARAGES